MSNLPYKRVVYEITMDFGSVAQTSEDIGETSTIETIMYKLLVEFKNRHKMNDFRMVMKSMVYPKLHIEDDQT